MLWIYLSPHLDDVALSAGGLLWEQARAGDQVDVWTICAGDPASERFSPFAESLHSRWGVGRDAVAIRRSEDIQSCAVLGVAHHHFALRDCIYRASEKTGAYLYPSESAIFDSLHPDDHPVIVQLTRDIAAKLPKKARIVCPLAIGGHVDHQLTRAAAERLGISLWYYQDFPYVLDLPLVVPKGLSAHIFTVSSAGMQAWQDSIAAHSSQINTFWGNIQEMQMSILAYSQQVQGILLWH